MTAPAKLSPLYNHVMALGIPFIEIDGWQVPRVYTSIEEEILTASQDVGLVDASASSKIMVEGADVSSLIGETFGIDPPPISHGGIIAPGYIYRLRNDQYFLHLPVGSADKVAQLLHEKAGETGVRATVTDITHGYADLILIGPKSPVLLSRLCALDFHPSQFSSGTAKHGSLAKTRQLILHQVLQTPDGSPLPAYSLIGARSLALYLWSVILEAGQDLALRPIGHEALEKIASKN